MKKHDFEVGQKITVIGGGTYYSSTYPGEVYEIVSVLEDQDLIVRVPTGYTQAIRWQDAIPLKGHRVKYLRIPVEQIREDLKKAACQCYASLISNHKTKYKVFCSGLEKEILAIASKVDQQSFVQARLYNYRKVVKK